MKLLRHMMTVALAATTLASCAQTSAPAETEAQRLAQELRTMIGPAACTADSECRSLPVGARACGGPAGYWAWSTQSSDAKQLQALAQRQAEAQKRENAVSGMQSDCRMLIDPGVACVAKRCELQSKPGGAAAAR